MIPDRHNLLSQGREIAKPDLSDDLVRTVPAIAEFVLGDRSVKNKKCIYYLISKGALPVFRMGATICARKSTLISWIEKQERDSTKGAKNEFVEGPQPGEYFGRHAR